MAEPTRNPVCDATNDPLYEPPRRRALGERREKEIREGLAPGCVWIAFPSSYARQLLRELDLTRRERDLARAALTSPEART